MKIKKLISERVVIFDGAMGSEINSKVGGKVSFSFGDMLNIGMPDVIKDIHLSYIYAGADVIETNTFNSNPLVLSKWGMADIAPELNKKAVEIAKSAIKESSKDVLIAGSVGPGDFSLSLGNELSFEDVKKAYTVQIESLLSSGVDLIIFETFHDILNLKAVLNSLIDVIGRKDNLPAIASVTLDKNGFMLSGQDIRAAYFSIEHFELVAFGINCSVGPADMSQHISELSRVSRFPVFIMPNAGFYREGYGYDVDPQHFGDIIYDYARKGYINIAGGCCGTDHRYIKNISLKLKGVEGRKLKNERYFSLSHKISFSDDDTPGPYIISERLNVVGSKRFRILVNNEDTDDILNLAKSEISKGVHALDICFTSSERDEVEDFKKFFGLISKNIKNPFSIDSTNPILFELASQISGSKPLFNSVNFEKGADNVIRVMDIALKYGASVVFSLTAEDGKLPYTFEDKMRNAQMFYDFILKEGFPLHLAVFDPLVFPVASSPYKFSARDSLDAVYEIKKRYNVKTLLGVSNISYGLSPKLRRYINSIFLNLAVTKGLDIAIINPSDRVLYSDIEQEIKKKIELLIFNGDRKLLAELHSIVENINTSYSHSSDIKDPFHMLADRIITGTTDNLVDILSSLIEKNNPLDIINRIVVPAMNEVGEMFSNGRYIITDVLSSASVSRKIIDFLHPYIKDCGVKKSKLLIATVKGDVHDIGKNLVSIIFSSNGFEVIDLGVRVDPEVVVNKAFEVKPDIIGLSALLVRSTDYILETAFIMKEKKLNIPLLVGGAGVSEVFVEKKLKSVYPFSFYAKDAVEGVRIAKNILVNRNEF